MTSACWFTADAQLGRNDLSREVGDFASLWALRPPNLHLERGRTVLVGDGPRRMVIESEAPVWTGNRAQRACRSSVFTFRKRTSVMRMRCSPGGPDLSPSIPSSTVRGDLYAVAFARRR